MKLLLLFLTKQAAAIIIYSLIAAGSVGALGFLVVGTCGFLGCRNPIQDKNVTCDACDKQKLGKCLNKAFPVGSSGIDLDRYLVEAGFRKSNGIAENRIIYTWSAQNNTYIVRVIVTIDEHLFTIKDIYVGQLF
jgi:hypothetical protein